MLGNVWEWCRDGMRDYTAEPAVDPVGPEEPGASRVHRGGSWGSDARYVRCASRDALQPGLRYDVLGFRCARVQG
jgi:formylglycine-generating enzyme required for sulfatase activity